MAVPGENQWPSVGNSRGRLWGILMAIVSSVSGAGLLVEFSYVTHGGQSDNF